MQDISEKIEYFTSIMLKQQSLDIVGSNITKARMAPASVSTVALSDRSVTASKMASLSVDTPNLIDGSVTMLKLADASVGVGNLVDGSVTAAKLADASVGTTSIMNASVTASKLADASVGTPSLIYGAVTASKLAVNSVGSTSLIFGCVTASKMAVRSVQTANIVDGSVTASKLQVGITTSNLVNLGTVVTNGLMVNNDVVFAGGFSNIAGITYAAKITSALLSNCDLSECMIPEVWKKDIQRICALPSFITFSSCNMGIGTDTPAYTLDVKGDIHASGNLVTKGFKMFRPVAPGALENTGCGTGSGVWTASDAHAAATYLLSSNVGIGTSEPEFPLDVVGTARFGNVICTGDISAVNITWLSNAATWASNQASRTFKISGTTGDGGGAYPSQFPVGVSYSDVVHASGMIDAGNGRRVPVGPNLDEHASSQLRLQSDAVYLDIPSSSTALVLRPYTLILMV